MADETPAQRLRLALEMYELGEQMLRARLRRLRPSATEADIDAEIQAWLLAKPEASVGKGFGRPTHRFA